MAATAAESIGSMQIVQSLSLESVFSDAFGAANDRARKADVRGKRLAAGLERSVDVFIAAASALVLWQGAHLVLRQQLTPGDLIVFLAYLKTAFRPLQDFAKYTARLAKATAAGARVMELLPVAPSAHDAAETIAPPLSGRIEFAHVTFGYETSRNDLKDLSFVITPGQRVAIVGPSGTGKSTVLRLLLRLYRPTHGTVALDGTDIQTWSAESLRRQMSVVLQDNAMFAGTLRENITLGLGTVSQETVERATRLASAHDFITRLPLGYDTPVGERGVTLSQGQRQRLAIARAALRDTPFLLLDEPTAGLDPENERTVTEALLRLSHGRTTLWVTHDLNHARQADLILHFVEGSLVETGSPAMLAHANGPYAQIWREHQPSTRPSHAHA
jgi:ATP-binding cassette, subfamily B, bacterial